MAVRNCSFDADEDNALSGLSGIIHDLRDRCPILSAEHLIRDVFQKFLQFIVCHSTFSSYQSGLP